MSMTQFQLENFHLNRLEISCVNDARYEGESVMLECQAAIDYDVAHHPTEPWRRSMTLRCSFTHRYQGNPLGYQINVEIVGFYSVSEDLNKPDKEFAVRVAAVNILYGALRGVVGAATGSFQQGMFALPTVLSGEVVKAVESKRAKLAAKNKAAGASPSVVSIQP